MRCKLIRTSNYKMSQFVGKEGELTHNYKGGYTFKMDNGFRIETNEVMPNTTLGDVNYPNSPSVSFTTSSGSTYDFENIERERAVDGCFKSNDGVFLGYDEPDICDD